MASNQLLAQVVVVQSLSHVRLAVTLWTAAHRASLSLTISQSLLKFMSVESVMLSNHLIFVQAEDISAYFRNILGILCFRISVSIHQHDYLPAAAAAKSLQSCPTLCDPTDSSPPGSPIPGILQARTLVNL